MTQTAPQSPSEVRRIGLPVVLDYLFSHLGFFTVLPILPLLIGRLVPNASPLLVGSALFAFNFTVRGASLFCARVLNRTPVRRAMAAGLVLAACGFASLPFAPGPWGVISCLMVVGTGISLNGLMARVYVAKMLSGAADRNTVFSAVQVAVNIAAAVGPVIGNLFMAKDLIALVLSGAGAMYLLAAAIVLRCVPAGILPGAGEMREPLRLGLLRAIWADPMVRRVSIVTAVGSFLYAQFFSAIALHVADLTQSTFARASVFTLNAVCVVLMQIPVAVFTKKRLDAGASPLGFLAFGALVFVVSFAATAVIGSLLAGVFLTVVLFSLAETLFTPMVNTAFAAVPGNRPLVEIFNLRQIAATVGESAGGFAGGMFYLIAAKHHQVHLYWLALSVGGASLLAPVMRGGKS